MVLYGTVFGGGWLPYVLRVAWARGLLGGGDIIIIILTIILYYFEVLID